MTLPRAEARGYEQVTAARGTTPWIRTVADRTGWWLYVCPLGWGNQSLEWRYGPLAGAAEASRWLATLRRDLAQAPNGDARGVLERWRDEKPWEATNAAP
jgi:hypothetical protein